MNLDITRTKINKIVLFMNTFLEFYGLEQDILSKIRDDASSIWQCIICSYSSRYKGDVKKHVEAKHIQSGGYNCEICGKYCPSINALKSHNARNHREMK